MCAPQSGGGPAKAQSGRAAQVYTRAGCAIRDRVHELWEAVEGYGIQVGGEEHTGGESAWGTGQGGESECAFGFQVRTSSDLAAWKRAK